MGSWKIVATAWKLIWHHKTAVLSLIPFVLIMNAVTLLRIPAPAALVFSIAGCSIHAGVLGWAQETLTSM